MSLYVIYDLAHLGYDSFGIHISVIQPTTLRLYLILSVHQYFLIICKIFCNTCVLFIHFVYIIFLESLCVYDFFNYFVYMLCSLHFSLV